MSNEKMIVLLFACLIFTGCGSAAGSSVAEKLNEMMGGYNSSNYEFHYSVDESQLNELIKDYE